MRKIAFILNLVLSTLVFAQNPVSSTLFEKEYYDLMNYVPENFNTDIIYKPDSQLLKTELNTIGTLRLYSGFKEDFNLSENDKKWLESRIDQIASALFIDGKKVLIIAVGDYSGCPEKMIDSIQLNNIKITELKFCNSCTDSNRDDNFIRIFNDRMYSLMEIEPSNRKTD